MIRVLHILDSMGMGGIQSFVLNLYRSIDRNKIQFDFLLHREFHNENEAEIRQLGGKIYFIPTRREGINKNKKALKDFFLEHQEYSAVHFHISSLTYIEPLKAATYAKIPVRIVHSHSSQAPKNNRLHRVLHEWNKHRIHKYATHFCACSDKAAEWFYGGTKLFKHSIFIPNGIQCDAYSFDPDMRIKYKKEFELDDKLVIGHVGRFHYPKNHEFLIEIFSAYSKNRDNAVLVLVGDGENRVNIEQMVNAYGLSKKVVFLGNRNDVKNLLQMFDIFLLPSRYEGFPVTLVEAEAASLPAIVSDSITHAVNITGRIRFCSLNDTPDIWANQIDDLICDNRDPEDNLKVRKAGYDICDIVDKLFIMYSDITS